MFQIILLFINFIRAFEVFNSNRVIQTGIKIIIVIIKEFTNLVM